ncbi:40-kDa huntingtin-associated protein [Plodia interpunctella]|uniref:40-kDa huntingtin-associated protein n=1 Tax=Plodia interpunctella TaxID=58824 RepID=UPI00236878CC|nr:40-kDa huntingtin-associated protein [Plodia interpunctella]XP_053610547.1 40-kDa huntingtin-associated protein [Plodia interpunctella]
MSTDLFASFNEQYMNINTKLKKRFMRKPNISEATNEFIALAIQCEHSEQPAFAGHAYVGAAKCEATAGNALGEAEYYIAAARQFMKAEKKLVSLKFSSPDRENLEAAIGCYLQALTKYPEKSLLRTSILMEIADHLIDLNHKSEAVGYYQQALEDMEEKTMKIVHLRNLVNLLIDCDKFEVALDTANSMIDSYTGIPEDILAEIQTSRVLLTLLVEPLEDSKPESLKQLFTSIMNDCETDMFPINVELRLKLQSLMLSLALGAAPPALGDLTRRQADLVDRLNVAR